MRLMLLLFFLTFFTIHTSELLHFGGKKDIVAFQFFTICLELNNQFESCKNEHAVLSDSDYEQLSSRLKKLGMYYDSLRFFLLDKRLVYFSDSVKKILTEGGIGADDKKKIIEQFDAILTNNEDKIKKIQESQLIFQSCFQQLVDVCKKSAIDFSQNDKKRFEVGNVNKRVSQESQIKIIENADEKSLFDIFGPEFDQVEFVESSKVSSPKPLNREENSEVVKSDSRVNKNPELPDKEKENISEPTNSDPKIALPNKKEDKDSLSKWFLKHIKSPFILVPLVCLSVGGCLALYFKYFATNKIQFLGELQNHLTYLKTLIGR